MPEVPVPTLSSAPEHTGNGIAPVRDTASSPGTSTPAPATADPSAAVGPLFPAGLNRPHGCTATVIASPKQDLILTAAHCVAGSVTGWVFVPGYQYGRAPYGAWQVMRSYVDPLWQSSRDEDRDYAVLQVAHQRRDGRVVGIQAVTGGNPLSLAPPAGQKISVVAYNHGLDDAPVRCTTAVYDTGNEPSFDCDGFTNGTSGGPWLARSDRGDAYAVRGLIGGLHQGGCTPSTSYSPVFTAAIFELVARETAGAEGDTPARAPSDC